MHPFIAGGGLASWRLELDDREMLFAKNEEVVEEPKAPPVQSQPMEMNDADFLSMF